MVAAENDALRRVRTTEGEFTGKVGGIGDVVRDAPRALAERGCQVTVVTPGYGIYGTLPDGHRLAGLEVTFGGGRHYVELHQAPARETCPGVRLLVIEHPLLAPCGKGRIYCNDPPQRAFASDASKFALFCAAVAAGIEQGSFGEQDVLHLHDWHAAFLLILRHYDPNANKLRHLRCAYTIHNLALQGIRPFDGDASSLRAWYPHFAVDGARLADPRWKDCVNPMAVGVRLADAVHAVSPAYAKEILRPSAVAAHGFYGGEGLEEDLRRADADGRLFGILNGCEYPSGTAPRASAWSEVRELMCSQVLRWAAQNRNLASAQFIAHQRLTSLGESRPSFVLTSVGRITDQKVRLLREPGGDGRPALDILLEALGEQALLILLGSGDTDYEDFLTTSAARHDNFLFLRGYSDTLAELLYAEGDLFLMPSSFEPCGISQMLALRNGQPCLVHNVGGLRDTVREGVNGFTFEGSGMNEQVDNMVASLRRALTMWRDQPAHWQGLRRAAQGARFSWSDSVEAYLGDLYQPSAGHGTH
jgi:starch synthase